MKPKARNLILELLLAANGEPLSARDAITACADAGLASGFFSRQRSTMRSKATGMSRVLTPGTGDGST